MLLEGMVGWFANAANTYRIASEIDSFRCGFGKKQPKGFDQVFKELIPYTPQRELKDTDIFNMLEQETK